MGIFIGDLVIPLNTKPSNVLSGRILRTLRSITIIAPASLDGTVTVQVPDGIGSSPTFVNLTRPSGSAGGHEDVTIASSKAITLDSVPTHGFRVNSGANEDPAKTFPVFGEEKSHT